MTLKFIGAIPDFAKPVEAHDAGQGVFCLTLIQSGSHALAQAWVEQPIQRKNSPLNAPDFAQGERQACQSVSIFTMNQRVFSSEKFQVLLIA